MYDVNVEIKQGYEIVKKIVTAFEMPPLDIPIADDVVSTRIDGELKRLNKGSLAKIPDNQSYASLLSDDYSIKLQLAAALLVWISRDTSVRQMLDEHVTNGPVEQIQKVLTHLRVDQVFRYYAETVSTRVLYEENIDDLCHRINLAIRQPVCQPWKPMF